MLVTHDGETSTSIKISHTGWMAYKPDILSRGEAIPNIREKVDDYAKKLDNNSK